MEVDHVRIIKNDNAVTHPGNQVSSLSLKARNLIIAQALVGYEMIDIQRGA